MRVSRASTPIDVPDLTVLGVTWSAESAPGTSVQYRTQAKGAWSDWAFIEVDDDHGPDSAEATAAATDLGGAREGSAPLVSTDADKVQVRLLSPSGSTPSDAELLVVDPGTSTYDTALASTSSAATGTAAAATTVPMPSIYTRAQWGADESLRDPSEPDYGVVDAAFVHHTAGGNDYTADQVPSIIRGIYEYHVTGHGWRDIGYNFLVDRFGRTWEGRYGGMDKAVVGAHTYGVNSWTFGVSVLGDFETTTPNSSILTALSKLIAWKADIHRFDVVGRPIINGNEYNGISGHRDAYDNSTLCPGKYLYAQLPSLRTTTAALSPTADRVAGPDRYATAAATSKDAFAPGVPVAYIATGLNFPDALAGAAAGGHLDGPVLLTDTSTLPDVTRTELTRLKPARIAVLGSAPVVSDGVLADLRAYSGTVTRVAGQDRYATAAATSKDAFAPGVPVAYVATGLNFPDALAGAAAGGHLDGPVLLTDTTTLPDATRAELTRLKPARIAVLGSAPVVSDGVLADLRAYSGTVSRVAGQDRYATAAATSKDAFAPGVPVAYVATGLNFPDALAGAAAGGHLDGPVLLTDTSTLPDATRLELTRLKPARIVVLGSAPVVSDAVARRLYNYEEPPAS